jgi:HK97 family phage prohead protease
MVGAFEETFARGAFRQSLSNEPDVVLLINHEGLPLARTRSGTMTLSEDTRGLKVDAELDPSDPDVQALVPKMKRGDLTEMSFAFRATDDEWDARETKRLVRSATIHKGDVSMVTHGANTTAAGSVRDALVLLEQRAASEDDRDAIERLKGLLEPGGESEAEEEKPELPPIIRSYVETARARKAKARRRP